MGTFLAAAVLVVVSWVGPVAADEPPRPSYYAITDVRVVSGAGAPIDGATVVLADGLITAVGTRVDVPDDAWVVDGSGLTLYPGLIDAMTTMGQKQDEGSGGGRGGGGGFPGSSGPQIRGPEDRPGTTPWVNVADELTDDARAEKWRKAGFTATVSAPTDGLFPGQAALVNLGGGEPRDRVVATPVAHRVNFRGTGGFRSFPGSLMGGISYVKQVLSDTRHYTASKALYEKSPLGHERPAYDRALEPLEQAIADGTPFLMPAHLGREIDRALAIRNGHDVRTVIYGGQGAYARTSELKSSGTPVLVSLDWPEEEKNRDPEADTPFRTLVHRRMAPTTPAALSAAGVGFAFYSDTLTSPSAIFEKTRTAIDAGLSNEDALAAWTSGAARIFGVDDRLGTIEKGKIANLVLASDWPWAEGVEVAAVFVDGHKFELRKEEEEGDPPASDVSGTWDVAMQTPRGAREMTAEIEMNEDGKVSGEIRGEQGDTPVDDGRMSGDLLSFKTSREMGGRSFTASWSLTIEGESLSGTMSAGPMTMDITGERTAKPEEGDEGEAVAEEDAGSEVSLDELREALALYQGPVGEMGSFAVTNATVWTVSGDTIENGTVVVKDGKIAAVGTDVRVPKKVPVIDAAGGALIPGIIDAHSHIAIDGGGNEGTVAVSSMVGIADVLNPDDIGIYRALAGGVTSANILHGSSNPIGGQNQVIKLRWGGDADALRFAGAMPGIKFALGENPKRSNFRGFGIPQRYPQTRMGVMDVIRQAFTEAREYRKAWSDYENAKAGGKRPMPPRRDLKLEPLVEIMEGKRLVHSHCYRADEILQLLRLAEEFGFRVATLQHVLEGYKVADEIAAHGAGASTFSDWWGYKVEAYDAIPHNAALMAERGVLVSINSDSGEEMRHLNQEAAKAVKWGGMDEVAALATVTLNPAKQFRIDDRVGSIEVGKDADLVLYDGHPLSIRSIVQKTWVDGDLYFDREADRTRQASIDEIKKRMLGTDEDEEEGDGEGGPSTGSDPPEVRWHDDTTYSCREVH